MSAVSIGLCSKHRREGGSEVGEGDLFPPPLLGRGLFPTPCPQGPVCRWRLEVRRVNINPKVAMALV